LPGNVTTTVTFTATKTTTQQIVAAPFLGIPTELWLILVAAAVILGYTFFKLQVKSMPVNVLLVRQNFSGLLLNAAEDIGGVFLYVFQGRKKVDTLKKVGRPIEVVIPGNNAKLYVEEKKRHGDGLDEKTLKGLKEQGYKVTEEKRSKAHQGYLLEKDVANEKVTGYLDMPRGGVKTLRLYTSVEGTGETVDYKELVTESKPQDATGTSGVLHEEINAVKTFLKEWAAAAVGTFKALVVPALMGGGIVGMVILLVLMLSGFHR
jgi:hypothetical protein